MTTLTACAARRVLGVWVLALGCAVLGSAALGPSSAAEAATGRCQTASESGFHEVAIPACDRLIEDTATRPSLRALALYYRANSNYSTGRPDAARADIETSLAITPDNGRAQALRGRILARAGQPGAAVEAFTRAIDLGFTEPQVYRQRGDLLLELGNADGALSDLRRAALAAPDDAVALTQLALAEQTAGRREVALETVTRAIAANPAYAAAYGVRAAIHSAGGDVEAALADYAAASTNDADDPRYRVGRADLLVRAGRLGEAMVDLQAALAIDPGLGVALDLKADILESQGQYAAALTALEATGRTGAEIMLRRARMALRLDRFDIAVPLYDRAIADPGPLAAADLAAAYFERGQARQRQGSAEGAAGDYTEALARDPSLAEHGLSFLRGKARFAIADYQGAAADFEDAAARAPNTPGPLIWQALTLAELGDFTAAEAAARQVVALAPDQARSHALLGDVLLKAGDLEDGRAAHQKALEIEPGFARSRERLDEISRAAP
jgi:tetratricopeptide (TPR) repeat protein